MMEQQSNSVKVADLPTTHQTSTNKKLLRFLSCGSVDDGKSTLIGRLLLDLKQVYDDQWQQVAIASKRVRADQQLDLALLVDGLQEEREQGITIDVAYRYFNSPQRKYIIADTPGHEQYTRNMVTGASNCDAAVLLVDAAAGLKKQTEHHARIVHLLGIRHVILIVNKMDTIGYDQDKFSSVLQQFTSWQEKHDKQATIQWTAIPVVATEGDNIVTRSKKMAWYTGPTLIEQLDNIEIVNDDHKSAAAQFAIQAVCRPNSDFRGYQGVVTSGKLIVGQKIYASPGGQSGTIERIINGYSECREAHKGQAVTITLEESLHISRGQWLLDNVCEGVREVQATLVWMDERPLQEKQLYRLRTKFSWTTVEVLPYHTDEVTNNDIVHATLRLVQPVFAQSYKSCKESGSWLLVDPVSYATVAAVLVDKIGINTDNELVQHEGFVNKVYEHVSVWFNKLLKR